MQKYIYVVVCFVVGCGLNTTPGGEATGPILVNGGVGAAGAAEWAPTTGGGASLPPQVSAPQAGAGAPQVTEPGLGPDAGMVGGPVLGPDAAVVAEPDATTAPQAGSSGGTGGGTGCGFLGTQPCPDAGAAGTGGIGAAGSAGGAGGTGGVLTGPEGGAYPGEIECTYVHPEFAEDCQRWVCFAPGSVSGATGPGAPREMIDDSDAPTAIDLCCVNGNIEQGASC